NPDSVLSIGSTFSQADVNAGRVVLAHQGGSVAPTSLQVVLRDEQASHGASTGTVAVVFYRPASGLSAAQLTASFSTAPLRLPRVTGLTADEEPMAVAYMLSKEMGFIVRDGADQALNLELAAPSSERTSSDYQSLYVPSYGLDRRHLFLGGAGSDRLSGSMEADILIGGRGQDTLYGHGGADLFVLCTTNDGNDIIADFSLSEGD